VDFDAEIIRPRDRKAEALSKWHQRVLSYMRKESRRIVRGAKERALSRARKLKRGSLSKREREQAWGFLSYEVLIEDDANEDRIEEVLSTIGLGDQFETLRERAYSEIDQPAILESMQSAEEVQRGLDDLAEQIRRAKTGSAGGI
jgi:hypothetical protein